MDVVDMARITYEVAVRIAQAADRVTERYNALEELGFTRPSPCDVHTASGLMLEASSHGGFFRLLTPWGHWKMPMPDYHSKECTEALLREFDAQLVPSDDPAYTHVQRRHMGWLFDVYALRRFGDIELPEAQSQPGLVSGHALEHHGMLGLYSHSYTPYWEKHDEWTRLAKEHDLSPGARAARERWARAKASVAILN